jgi:hypothetical protein
MARLVTWLPAPSSMVRRNRNAFRAIAPIAVSAIALLGACSSGDTATDGGGTSDGSSGGGSGSSSGGSGSGTEGGVKDATPDHVMADAAQCTAAPATGTLPFVVDSAFVPSGWMGDGPAYMAMPADDAGTPARPATTAAMTLEPVAYSSNSMDACTGTLDGAGKDVGRSHPGAQGRCYKVTFSPFPKGTGYGWVGAYWQNKKNNWGDQGPGYAIPAGATKITFWARGKFGQEWVKFFAGEGDATPCMDFAAAAGTVPPLTYLTTTWTKLTIDISNYPYALSSTMPSGVIGAFGFATGDQTTPQVAAAAAEAGIPDGGLPEGGVGFPCTDTNQVIGCTNSHLEFYIDDIEWTM